MPIVYMLVGIPGSGKSTFAKCLSQIEDIDIISSDEVRNLHPDWQEELIFPEVFRLIAEHLLTGKNVIYDATNITPKVRHRLVENLEPYNVDYEIGVYFFPTNWEECYRRIEIRNSLKGERFFPLEKVQSYGESLIEPTLDEGFKFVKKIK